MMPFLGTLNIGSCILIRNQKKTIILTTPHMDVAHNSHLHATAVPGPQKQVD